MHRIADRSAIARIPTPGSDAASYDLPDTAHMAHVVAHRLRGLVAGIEGFADLLLEQLAGPEQRDLAMRILESAHRIEHVLADLRYFTRPIEPVQEQTPIAALICDLVSTLPQATAERIRFELKVNEDRDVQTDPYLLREVMLLLIQNAIEAAAPADSIALSVEQHDDTLLVHVENPGTIPPDHVGRVFEPFFTTKARNLGVGLPMARRIARSLGGDVKLELVDQSEPTVQFALEVPATTAP